MTGQSYFGYRITKSEKKKWVQDVPKSERKIGPPCSSEACKTKKCRQFTDAIRQEIFTNFWFELDWAGKKRLVRSLVDNIPPKRRRLKHKGEVSRKGDSKLYHLVVNAERLKVCRVLFLNTLGIKEAMVRCWLIAKDAPKKPKEPIKALNVEAYIESLPKTEPKCQYCRNLTDVKYINMENVKNVHQLFNKYVQDMKLKGMVPASRKTFTKVFGSKSVKIFKPKNDTDICDLVNQHNVSNVSEYQNIDNIGVIVDTCKNFGQNVESVDGVVPVNFYYSNVQW